MKIHDLTFPSRERVASTFYEDLRGLVFTILDEEKELKSHYSTP